MPKKLNFLGGQQNYDAENGQYLPDLTNAQGEPVKSFKSFKKSDEETEKSSFDTYNDKRTGKETKNLEKELDKAKKRVYKFMPNLPSKKAMVSEMEGLLERFKSGNRPEEMLKTAKDNIQRWQRSRELDTNDLRDERLAYFEKIVDYMERNL